MAYDRNIDYQAQAVAAAGFKNWTGVQSAFNARQKKIAAQGGNDSGNDSGVSNAFMMENLQKEYRKGNNDRTPLVSSTNQQAQTAVGRTKTASTTQQQTQYADTNTSQAYPNQWLTNAQKQSDPQIDRATKQSINELAQVQEDTQTGFQEQQDAIDIEAKDNHTAAREDRGEIGAAQYNTVMNAAAQNCQIVRQAQQQLATDTQRLISNLRAQGEYEKADALLTLTQQYLSNLMQLQEWTTQYNLNPQQFNLQVERWFTNYQMQLQEIVDNTNPTDERQSENNSAYLVGQILLEAGILPSSTQLKAIGISREQARFIISSAAVKK